MARRANIERQRLPEDSTLLARLYCRCELDLETGCWAWARGTGSHGYGMAKIGSGPMKLIHRTVWELSHLEKIPAGLQIDHLCRNRRCCNPDHLEPVTPKENQHRGDSLISAKSKWTHCLHGHEFTPSNTLIHPQRGGRSCRTCKQARDRVYGKTRRAAEREAMHVH